MFLLRSSTRLLIGFVCVLGLLRSSHGAVSILIQDSGSDILITTSGSADITGWDAGTPIVNTPGFRIRPIAGGAVDLIAFGVGQQDFWQGTSPGAGIQFSYEDLGLLGVNTSPLSNSFSLESGGGDAGFRILEGEHVVWLPRGYTGGEISQVIRLENQSIANFGGSIGDAAIISWDGPNPDSITMRITPIPEPSAGILLFSVTFGLLLRSRRR